MGVLCSYISIELVFCDPSRDGGVWEWYLGAVSGLQQADNRNNSALEEYGNDIRKSKGTSTGRQ